MRYLKYKMYLTKYHFHNTKNYLYSKPVKGLKGFGVNYRFAFNGQEKDDEVSGAGNTMSATFWEYDSRLGRRWNIDPIPTVGLSDYSCFANSPIFLSDVNGDSPSVDGMKKSSTPPLPKSKYKSVRNAPAVKPKDMFTAECDLKGKLLGGKIGVKVGKADFKLEGSVLTGKIGAKSNEGIGGELGVGTGSFNANYKPVGGVDFSGALGKVKLSKKAACAEMLSVVAKLEVATKSSVEASGAAYTTATSGPKPIEIKVSQNNASVSSDSKLGFEFSLSALNVSLEANLDEIGKVWSSLGNMTGEAIFGKSIEVNEENRKKYNP